MKITLKEKNSRMEGSAFTLNLLKAPLSIKKQGKERILGILNF